MVPSTRPVLERDDSTGDEANRHWRLFLCLQRNTIGGVSGDKREPVGVTVTVIEEYCTSIESYLATCTGGKVPLRSMILRGSVRKEKG